MNPHTLSTYAQRALENARAEALRLGHDSIGAEHIVLGLLRGEGPAGALLVRLGLDPGVVEKRLESGGRRRQPRSTHEELAYTSHAKRLIEVASKEARESGTGLSAEHLLLAALQEPRGTLAKILGEAGVSPERAQAELQRVVHGDRSAPVAHPDLVARPTGGVPWRLLLFIAVPASMVLEWVVHASALPVFVVACLGVLPLASYMGEATEHLAHRTGPTIGGLLNATFGNAAELIISIVGLQAGLVQLVKASITGSILGNLLLILGLAMLAGGLKRNELRFNRTTAGMSAGMLALAVVALVLPALFHSLHPEQAARLSELRMSEAVAVILLITYGLSLLFTLRTHRCLFWSEGHAMEGPAWGAGKAILILGLATVGVAIESKLLVHAAIEATKTVGLTQTFLGLIIIPIIGNAAEHATAVLVARKGKMDLALQIALGSSTQVALLVAPILVFAGVVLGREMTLVFTPFEVIALGMATIVTAIITLDGESHWFEGVQLLAVYGMLAVGAFFLV
ncbi:MAG TPA: calcium/proton exchanger [Gemmatimonadales bacterium]|jgi:Ca2+:H+ antiporter|nr:calcium/proton exchanger [Gemmatimonadales bacterium]